ncbi:MAG: tetratricopeptide repeat protein [Acidobacteriaceae bacterium]|nr:tetratricopeptide repeat protein [Acidobacteriaceae bacterium]
MQTAALISQGEKRPRLAAGPSIEAQDAVIDLLRERRFDAAEQAARSLLCAYPAHSFGPKALAAVMAGQDRWSEALALYEQAAAACSNDWQFLNNYANALKMTGRLAEAVEVYRRSLALAPLKTLEPQYNMGLALVDLGRLEEAEQALLQVLRLDVLHGMGHMNLGNVYNVQGRLREAELHYRAALLSRADDARLQNNFALCLRRQHRYAEAEAHFRRALQLDPEYPTALSNYAEFLTMHGLMEEAVALLRLAVEADPTHAEAHSNLLFTMGHVDSVSLEQTLEAHRAFARQFEEPLLASWRPHKNVPDAERVLRVGFVSADLRDHPVVRYLRPTLLALQQGVKRFTLVAYNNNALQDEETERYRELFDVWRDVAHLSDEAFAEQVREDGVDVLLDLSGHTGHNRLLAFARKPAPVQMSWMGYVGTTGLRAMDYFIADPLLVPEDMRGQFCERLLMLPSTTSFAPCEEAPEIAPLPCLASGVFTYACLARMNKLNRRGVRLWARILREAQQSRLMLATMGDGKPPQTLLQWFAEEGIAAERLWFVHVSRVEQMLALHAEIDLALDTMPYNGSTSNNHALWMGVPTLTLAGASPVGRMGTALNLQMGLEEFLAEDEDDYVRRAVEVAGAPQRLQELRPTLRERFLGTALGRPEVVTEALVEGIRQAWRAWCAEQRR